METLAISHRPLPPSLRRSSAASILPPSVTLLNNTTRFLTLRCSAQSPTASVDHSVKFKEAAKHGNLIPLYRSIFSDHLTPVMAYRCLVKEDDRDAPSFLFESVEPGLKASNVGRYSVIGAQPTMEIVAKDDMVTVMDHHEGRKTEERVDDPMVVPRRIMEQWKPQRIDELPEAFCGGWVGYFSYDTVRYVEKKKLPFSKAPEDDRNLPDVHLGLYDDVIVFDHVEKKAYVIHWVRMDQYSSVDEAYKDGTDRLETLVSRARGCILVASSPEILTRVKKRKVTNRPLAGTIRRGKTPKEDYMLENQLLHDEKQCAEHIMLVDLGRNDVGKVSKPGSVNVEKLMNIERYSHVMHISSTVTGELLDELSTWDALRAALPVGTVSGAPKDANKRRDWLAHLQAGAGIVADSDPSDEHRECENKAAALARAIDLAESSFVDK
ncbi:hypothetical protein M8C21_007668 [Ambrosia artemisiifolia]|uniref:Anthranilate synthase n=1 Tax=Ambrosia artemisiifolia TaxID=4212 RepID=A0AAD5GW55_AMBAR|nr:hypothetical protein M8C21_007668 [Ambrosia artemisiifolia]